MLQMATYSQLKKISNSPIQKGDRSERFWQTMIGFISGSMLIAGQSPTQVLTWLF
jgi:hypothetical protein